MKDCPACEIGKLAKKKDINKITYKGVEGFVNFYYSVCDTCSSEIAGDWQLSVNKDNIIYFRKLVDDKRIEK